MTEVVFAGDATSFTGVVEFTPNANTPDTIYYQVWCFKFCFVVNIAPLRIEVLNDVDDVVLVVLIVVATQCYTHLKLGWRIYVRDADAPLALPGDTATRCPRGSPGGKKPNARVLFDDALFCHANEL